MMGPLLVVYAIIIVLLAVGTVLSHRPRRKRRTRRSSSESGTPAVIPMDWEPSAGMPVYGGRKHLLTRAELYFYRALEKAVGDDYLIMCQVSLRQIVRVRPMSPARSQTAFGRIGHKVMDYVLCDPDSMEIVAVLKLDDRNQRRSDRMHRDRFLNQVMDDAGIPMFRFPFRTGYTADQIRHKIEPLKHQQAA